MKFLKLTFLAGTTLLASSLFGQKLVNNGSHIVIGSGAQLVVAGTGAEYIHSDGEVNLTGTMKLYGDIVNNDDGNVFAGADLTDGAVVIAGTTNIGGTGSYVNLENVTVNSGATLNIPATEAATVNGSLTNNGDLNVGAASGGTGSLITLGAVSGNNADVSLYLANANQYYYLSAPTTDATAAVFGTSTALTNGEKKLYKPNANSTGWVQITTSTETLPSTKGYALKSSTSANSFTFTGALGTGNQTANLIATGYTLVGNPYPSALDWGLNTSIGWTAGTSFNTGAVLSSVWYRAGGSGGTGGGGTWYTYNRMGGGSVNGNVGSRYIPAMQSFWIENEGAATTLQVTNDARVHSNQAHYKTAPTSKGMTIAVADANQSDEMLIAFNEDASDSYDLYDSKKFMATTSPQFYSIHEGKKLAINTYSQFNEDLVIPVGFNAPAVGIFSVSLKDFNEFKTTTAVYIEDKTAGVLHDLRNGNYSFGSDEGTYTNRFNIRFKSVTDIPQEPTDNSLSVYSFAKTVYIKSSGKGTVTVFDVLGKEIVTNSLKGNTMYEMPLNVVDGVYTVKIVTDNQQLTQKITIAQ